MPTRYVARCSCGFASDPAPSSLDAVEAYRRHEKGHEPGQRRGEVETVEVAEVAAPAPKATRRRNSAPATPEEMPIW